MGRGGARTGAGRPARPPEEQTVPMPGWRAGQEEYLAVRKIVAIMGDGATISDAVRASVLAYAATLPEPPAMAMASRGI